MENIAIVNLMTSQLITLQPKDSIKTAEEIFYTHKIHHIPIVEDDKIVGILSKVDLIYLRKSPSDKNVDKEMNQDGIEDRTVDEIMTKHVIKVSYNDDILTVIRLFTKYRINAVPVVKDDDLLGIVTSYDLLLYMDDAIRRNIQNQS